MANIAGMRDRTVVVNSLSKTFSVTGWRVGWVIAAPALTPLEQWREHGKAPSEILASQVNGALLATPPTLATELPPEYEGLAVAIAGQDARAAMELWREVAGAMPAQRLETGVLRMLAAPHLFGIPIIFNILAVGIVTLRSMFSTSSRHWSLFGHQMLALAVGGGVVGGVPVQAPRSFHRAGTAGGATRFRAAVA